MNYIFLFYSYESSGFPFEPSGSVSSGSYTPGESYSGTIGSGGELHEHKTTHQGAIEQNKMQIQCHAYSP